MKLEPENVKGTQDFLIPESLKRDKIKRIIEKYYKIYGFSPIETPIIEYDELMAPDNLPNEQQDEAVSDRFRLKDRGNRSLGLRYEFTFQLSRILKQNPNIKLPFRRYQIGEVFRDEPTRSNRFREFTQCDIDIIGDPSVNADLDCLSCVYEILKELKIRPEIQINNRQLLKSIIESVQISQVGNIMRELDKLDKIGEDLVKLNLKKYADTNQVVTLFKLLEKPLSFFVENAFDGAKELQELIDKSAKYSMRLEFNPFMIRGFGYYTGNIFEVREQEKDSIAGGGRYDKSVGKYLGKDIPAVGISFGLERLSKLANIEANTLPTTLIISIDEESASLKLTKKLRNQNISCIKTDEKVGKALEYANSYNIPYVIFLGKDEISQEKFKLRNMKTGEEKLLTEKQLVKLLEKID